MEGEAQMSDELYNDIIHLMEERDMFRCCDYYDRSGFEDDLEMILFNYEIKEVDFDDDTDMSAIRGGE